MQVEADLIDVEESEPPPRRSPVFKRWRPRSQEDLERALEEYARFKDDVKIKQPLGVSGDADNERAWQRICCEQNPEIDLRMHRLLKRGHRCYCPTLWRLLHVYYREGMCYEARGWQIAAARCGMPAYKWRDGRNKRHVEKLLDAAIEQLWLAASDR